MFEQRRVLVTGAAGFIGSHLVDRLLKEGAKVFGLDNYLTGNKENLKEALEQTNFQMIEEDAVEWAKLHDSAAGQQFDDIFHLASPASPIAYQHNPVATYMVNSLGTHYLIEMAVNMEARFLFTSTSEIYGNPLEHPQKETYWGNVNPIGPRACYDESKRFGEMVVKTFIDKYHTDARTVRIFNTYGPRMQADDGRIIPNFITQALKREPITVEGDGAQTRSYCYIDDMVEYLIRAMTETRAKHEVINIGNITEYSVNEIAVMIKDLTASESQVVKVKGREEDIDRRQPDITKAKELLNYEPKVEIKEGLLKTIAYFKE